LEAARIYLFAAAVSLPLQSVYAASAGVMRATGNTRSPMFVSLLANFAYVGVSFLCIYGFKMGVMGAGVGLVVSRIVSSGASLRILLSGGGGLVLPRLTVRLDWKVLAPVLRIAFPVGADTAMFNGGKIIVQVFMSGMGTAALAANAIGNSLSIILLIPGNAMAIACMTSWGRVLAPARSGRPDPHDPPEPF
jgi:Na+-driven multidrug efflux pump